MSFEILHYRKINIVISARRVNDDYENIIYIPNFTVTENIDMIDNMVGLKDQLSTHFRRNKYFKNHYHFVKHRRIEIKDEDIEVKKFFYYIPVQDTLQRLILDPSFRKHMVHYTPTFTARDVSTISLIMFKVL